MPDWATGASYQNQRTQIVPINPHDPELEHRREIWHAFQDGLGINQHSPEYLAIEQRNRVSISHLTAGSSATPDDIREATRYLVRRWQAGGVRAHPTIAHVYAALGEYKTWVNDGRPPLDRIGRGTGRKKPDNQTVDKTDIAGWAANALEAAKERCRIAGEKQADIHILVHLDEMQDHGEIPEEVWRKAVGLMGRT